MKILPKSKFKIRDRGDYYEIIELATRNENSVQKTDRVARKLGVMDEATPYFAGFHPESAFRTDEEPQTRHDWDYILHPSAYRDREIAELKARRAAQIANNSKRKKP